MWSLWVSNGGTEGARDVQFQTRWSTDSHLFNVRTEEGLWLGARSRNAGQKQDRSSGAVDLPCRGSMQYVGLVVKYLAEDHAYVVSPETHRWFTRETTWRSPSQAIAPGLHFVDIAFRSREGNAAIIRLKVMNAGRDAALKVYLSTGQLV